MPSPRQRCGTCSLHRSPWKPPVCEVSQQLSATCSSLADSKSLLPSNRVLCIGCGGLNFLLVCPQLKRYLISGRSPVSSRVPGSCLVQACMSHWEMPSLMPCAIWQKLYRHWKRVGGVYQPERPVQSGHGQRGTVGSGESSHRLVAVQETC